MKTLRFVISDVDGTLVRSDKSLSRANEEAVRSLRAAGVRFSLISARPPSGMRWIVDRLDLEGPFGAFNGGTIFDRSGTVGEPHRLDPRLARDMLSLFERRGVIRWLYADGDWLINAADLRHTPREVLSAGLDPVITQELRERVARVDKLVAVSDDDELLSRIEAEARELAGERATIARSQRYYLDVTALAANKGDGVAALAAAARVPLDCLAVLGDQQNDLPMFARAGFAVAMGQASGDVQAKADAVAASNDEDGVADAIVRLLLPRVR